MKRREREKTPSATISYYGQRGKRVNKQIVHAQTVAKCWLSKLNYVTFFSSSSSVRKWDMDRLGFMTGANLNVLFDATWTTHEIRGEGAHGCAKKKKNICKIDDTDWGLNGCCCLRMPATRISAFACFRLRSCRPNISINLLHRHQTRCVPY